jgi:hypothetical protein
MNLFVTHKTNHVAFWREDHEFLLSTETRRMSLNVLCFATGTIIFIIGLRVIHSDYADWNTVLHRLIGFV